MKISYELYRYIDIIIYTEIIKVCLIFVIISKIMLDFWGLGLYNQVIE